MLHTRARQISDIRTLAAVVTKLRYLRTVVVSGNPCFPGDSSDHRVQLLALLPNITSPSFKLVINSVPVTIEERVAAARPRLVGVEPIESQCSRLRMTLVLSELDVNGSEVVLDLSNRSLTRMLDLVMRKQLVVGLCVVLCYTGGLLCHCHCCTQLLVVWGLSSTLSCVHLWLHGC